jgi:hypothetical protein
MHGVINASKETEGNKAAIGSATTSAWKKEYMAPYKPLPQTCYIPTHG